MVNSKYKKAVAKIQASDQFKNNTLQRLNSIKERRIGLKMSKKILIGLTTCFILMMGVIGFNLHQRSQISAIDLTDRIVVDSNAVSGKAVVNIEGIIVEVGSDGLSFKLDNGKWVQVTDDTEIGITGPTAAPKDQQLFEPTFRVGNSIAGFTLNEKVNEIKAYAIYTNWNWDDPIR